ncbi:tetratricopeptide repeat protein [Microseira sp. BLCC-F43]|jgi:tetratricopeptide (TPR) repeat protein|uniref:tetratricopeptide repeat protein n=1 Tax=Microseira sp. BLCC-F43 TaxID=3153602 RepID=UPI0035BAAA28
MSQNQDFSEFSYSRLTPEERQAQLVDENVPVALKALLLFHEGLHLANSGNYQLAIALYDRSLEFIPDAFEVWYHQGVALSNLGRYKDAIASYNKAIDWQPDCYEAWSEKGYCLSILGRHKEGLACCDKAIKINPDYYKSWCGRADILSRLNRRKQALSSCDKALELKPDSHEAWNVRGLLSNRRQAALACFEKALEIQPDYAKSWYNRGLLLFRLGKNELALDCFQKALEIKPNSQEFWHSQAWYGRGYMLAKFRRYEEAIACFEKALSLQPDYPAPALYKLIILILSGKFFHHIAHPTKRQTLWRDLKTILYSVKYLLIGFLAIIIINTYAKGAGMMVLQETLSVVFSVGILCLFMWELWLNRTNLKFVWQIYRRGIITYIRAFLILIITLSTLVAVASVVPPIMRWGWASAVFGNSGNLVFQPITTVQKIKPSQEVEKPKIAPPLEKKPQAANTPKSVPPSENSTKVQPVKEANQNKTSPEINIDYAQIITVGIWIVLMLLVPFWANFEEKIFRQGANTWKQILIRSTQFGLVHILVGIPIFAGFVLIIPGFLFACRYKYIHDKNLKQTNDEKMAQEAGVEASTADHAIYNAILITFVVAAMFL